MDLTELRDAQTAGRALFLGMSAWVSWEEISTCITRLSKDAFTDTGGIIQTIQSLKRTKEQRKDEFTLGWS